MKRFNMCLWNEICDLNRITALAYKGGIFHFVKWLQLSHIEKFVSGGKTTTTKKLVCQLNMESVHN